VGQTLLSAAFDLVFDLGNFLNQESRPKAADKSIRPTLFREQIYTGI